MQAQPDLSGFLAVDGDDKVAELRRTKIMATALLALAMVIFVVASIFEKQYGWVGFVRAAAEAAMVGAIADWFAVTALFRHPLGLPIPHTAIIPRRKDSLARSFGEFVQNNFLSEQVIATRLHQLGVAQTAARWLVLPENSQFVAELSAAALQGVLQVVRDEEVQPVIEHSLVAQIRSAPVTPALGNLLAMLAAGNRQNDVRLGVVKLLSHLLEENRAVIQAYISSETPWWLPKVVDRKIYERFVGSLEETLQEVDKNPAHPFHAKFDALLQDFIEQLKTSPEMAAQGEAWKEDFLASPAVREFSSSLWLDVKTWLLDRSSEQNIRLRETIQRSLSKFSESLQHDPVLLDKINRWAEAAARYLIREYGHEVGKLITTTIVEWDAEATSRKIELQVGKDLQYIRVNGTIVGGLVGLAIHTVSVLFL